MNKNTVIILLIALLLLNAYKNDTIKSISNKNDKPIVVVDTKPIPKIEYTLDQVLDLIKIEDVKKYVETLASKDFDGRATGTKGNEKAVNFICSHLDYLKIPYVKQNFIAKGNQTSNIIAYITPSKIKDDRIIVIGAHFDHLGSRGSTYYPGADDNASGVAGLMAIASSLIKYQDKLSHTISLQFYSAEEIGLIGSAYYTNNPLFPKDNPDIDKHMAMINLDMIGYLKRQYNASDNCTLWRSDKQWRVFHYESSFKIQDIVSELSSKYPFAKNISGYRPGGSDHGPFYNKGVPVVFFHTGSHPNYHKPSDTPEKLNYEGLVSVSKLALETAIAIDKN